MDAYSIKFSTRLKTFLSSLKFVVVGTTIIFGVWKLIKNGDNYTDHFAINIYPCLHECYCAFLTGSFPVDSVIR